jgi:hypothetical protein
MARTASAPTGWGHFLRKLPYHSSSLDEAHPATRSTRTACDRDTGLQISASAMYVGAMRQYEYEPCIPTRGKRFRPGLTGFMRSSTCRHDDEVQLYAFDILALEGDDLRKLPLHHRKTNLARLLARRPEGIFVSGFEQGEIGPDLFRQACKFGLEGLVSVSVLAANGSMFQMMP